VNRALEGTDVPPNIRAELLQRAAQIASLRHDYRALEPLAKILVEIHERSGDAAGLGKALQLLVNAKVGLGNDSEAEAFQMRALEQFRVAEDGQGIAAALGNLGTLQEQVHLNYSAAKQLLLRSFEMFKEMGAILSCASILGNLSVACMRNGDTEDALKFGQQSLMLFRKLGNEAEAANQQVNIAEIFLEMGSLNEALQAARTARPALGERPDRFFFACYLETVFKIAVAMRSYDVAAKLYGYASRHRNSARLPLQRSEHASMQTWHRRLAREVGTLTLDRLTSDGSALEATAIEGLIATLGPAPKQPSAVS
jgi:tetratricopeptide (TPR) repeat protein